MAVKQPGNTPQVKARAVEQAVTLLPLTLKAVLLAGGGAFPWRSHWLPIGGYPVGSIHIYGGTLTGLSAKVLVSNIAKDGAGMVIATVTAEALVPWGIATTHPAAQFLQVQIDALDDGAAAGVGLEAHLAATAGA